MEGGLDLEKQTSIPVEAELFFLTSLFIEHSLMKRGFLFDSSATGAEYQVLDIQRLLFDELLRRKMGLPLTNAIEFRGAQTQAPSKPDNAQTVGPSRGER